MDQDQEMKELKEKIYFCETVKEQWTKMCHNILEDQVEKYGEEQRSKLKSWIVESLSATIVDLLLEWTEDPVGAAQCNSKILEERIKFIMQEKMN